MQIHKSYKTEIKPNNKQKTLLLKHAGCARKIWNWALDRIKTGQSKPGAYQLSREMTIEKQDQFSYMYEVSNTTLQISLQNLEKAFKNFFAKRASYPKFKSKNKGIGSFSLARIKMTHNKVKLPKIGWVRLKQHNYIPSDKHILSATVSERAGRWYVSVQVREEIEIQNNNKGVLGIDLGVKTLATASDGSQYANPKALFQLEKRIKHHQRKLAKRKKKSNRRQKLKTKITKLYQRVANVRKDATHKATTEVVKTKRPQIIVMEDLSVSDMVKSKLAKSVYDANMREFRRQIEYKSAWNGIEVQFVDRYFPSSKMCSNCGQVKKNLSLSERTYKCKCGFKLDRDLNAAINLKNTARSAGMNARGDGKIHAEKQVAVCETRTEHNFCKF